MISHPKSRRNEIVGTTNISIAAIPSAWLRRNVLQPWDGGSRRLTMYLATLVCPISTPSLSNSPWIRGAPHSGLAILISRISLRISGGTVGRPLPRREFHLQYDLNPARCHFMTVSGFTIARALRTVGAKRYNPTKIKRSAVLKVCLFGEFRRSTLIWCRRTRTSAANEARDRNNPTNAVQIRLKASFIGQKDCVIPPQLSARLGLRQGQEGMGPSAIAKALKIGRASVYRALEN